MKNLFSKIAAVLLIWPATFDFSQAQCISVIGAGNFSANGNTYTQQQAFACNFAGDFVTITVPAGYWEFETSVATDFLTITDISNNVLSTGVGSVYFSSANTTVLRLHIFANSACDEDFNCRASYVTKQPIPVPTVSSSDTLLCQGAQMVMLTAANMFGDETYWYSGACGGIPIDSGEYVTVNVSATTTFYAANYLAGEYSDCDSITVVLGNDPVVNTVLFTNTLCYGDSSATIVVSGSASTGPYNYQWSNGVMADSNLNLPADTYTVTVEDVYGCETIVEYIVNNTDSITASINILNIPACAGLLTGELEVIASGGVGGFEYLWSNGDTGAIADSLGAQTHTVTITDANGCVYEADETIVSPVLVDVNLIDIGDSLLCFGDSSGFIEVLGSGGTGMLGYSWSNGNTGAQVMELPAGVYTVTVTDENGCEVLLSDTIYQPDQISSGLVVSGTSCDDTQNGMIASNISGGVPPYDITWSTSDTTTIIQNLDSGVYTISIFDVNNCTILDTAYVEVLYANPIVPIDSIVWICNNFSTSVNAGNPGANYLWSTGDTTQHVTLAPMDTGSQWVVVTDSNGCSTYQDFVGIEVNCLGVDDLSGDIHWKLYPNPAFGQVVVDATNDADGVIEIRNMQGALVYKRQLIGSLSRIDVTSLAAGTYVVSLCTERGVSVKRMVKY